MEKSGFWDNRSSITERQMRFKNVSSSAFPLNNSFESLVLKPPPAGGTAVKASRSLLLADEADKCDFSKANTLLVKW
jgi:hypothetical protein